MPYLAYDNDSNTTESCISACLDAGYQYAGTQYSSQCFCGNSYGGQGTSTNCNMPCTGDSSETCGGTWANDVYATRTCVPSCGTNQCGDDGCGGSCGTCPGGQTCSSGQCVSGGAAVVQTLTDHDVSSSHGNGTQKCVWQFSQAIGAGNTVVGYVHSANDSDTTEMYPQSVYDDAGNTYSLSPGVHWAPYPEDIGIWYLTNIQGNPSALTFDYTQYPASGDTVLDFCDLGFVEYSGVTGINAVVGPINDNAASPYPSLTISPTAPSLIFALGATNSGPGDGSDLVTSGFSLLVNDEPTDGLGVWGSNSTVQAGQVTLTWDNSTYWNASVCADGTPTSTGCTTVMAAVALSVDPGTPATTSSSKASPIDHNSRQRSRRRTGRPPSRP